MARSQFVWLVAYEDGKVDLVKAQSVFQIIEYGKLSQDADSIIFINRIELVSTYSGYEGIIEIPFQN